MTSDQKSGESNLDYRVRTYNEATAAFQKQQHELAEKEKEEKRNQTGTKKG